MFNPHNTTYGSMLNVRSISESLKAYLTTTNTNNLEYEYPTNDIRCVFITGYNEEESELPAWEHPLVVKSLNGTTFVASDVRKYVTSVTEQPARLDDVSRDANGLNFIILRSLLVKDFLEGNVNKHRAIYKPVATAMGTWLSGMINTIVLLDPVEMFNVEIVSSMYANTLFYNKEDIDTNLDVISARVINSKHTYNINKKEIKAISENYNLEDAGSMANLFFNIGLVLPQNKAQFITVDSLVGSLGNVWYGPGGSEVPIMCLENMPTWLAVLYSVITNRSYSKSRIGTLLNKHKRVIDSTVVDKHFKEYLKNIKVE